MKPWKRFIIYYVVSLILFSGIFLAIIYRENKREHAVEQQKVYFENVRESEIQ